MTHGIGYALSCSVATALYVHAYNLRDQLILEEFEIFETRLAIIFLSKLTAIVVSWPPPRPAYQRSHWRALRGDKQ